MKLKEVEALNSVGEFHETFGLPVLSEPTIPSKERTELRVNLLSEELDELKEAIQAGDIVEIADALADLQYVLSGAILEFGLGSSFKALFDEVHRSNMSKTCKTRAEAEATVMHYLERKNEQGYIEEKSDCFIVHRKGDGKVLKSIAYSPANLSSVLLDTNK